MKALLAGAAIAATVVAVQPTQTTQTTDQVAQTGNQRHAHRAHRHHGHTHHDHHRRKRFDNFRHRHRHHHRPNCRRGFLGGRKPTRGGVSRHGGYSWARWAGDISVPGSRDWGNKVRAWRGGRVVDVTKLRSSYGKHVEVRHPGGRETLYAHLSRIRVHRGQRVRCGKTLGRVGSTGNSTGPHLHFEIQW